MDLQGVNSQAVDSQAVARFSASFQISKPSTGPTSLSKERNKLLRFRRRHPVDQVLAIAIHPFQSPSPASMGWRPLVLSSFTLQLAAQQGKAMGSSVVLSNPEDRNGNEGITQRRQSKDQAQRHAPIRREVGRCGERIWQAKSLGFANNRLLLPWQESHGVHHQRSQCLAAGLTAA